MPYQLAGAALEQGNTEDSTEKAECRVCRNKDLLQFGTQSPGEEYGECSHAKNQLKNDLKRMEPTVLPAQTQAGIMPVLSIQVRNPHDSWVLSEMILPQY